MLKRSVNEVPIEDVVMDGVSSTTIQWLFSRKEGAPNFSMRRFVISPGGSIGLHGHPWEHEIFFLSGKGVAYTDKERTIVGPGTALFMPGGEPHGYDNTGDEDLVFLCMIPNSGDTRKTA